jgi:trehalose 6-phosphate phosphatase
MSEATIAGILQQQPLGLLFDIDGTLSPIAPTPAEAQLYPGVADLLRDLQRYAHVGIITGRGVVDGARLVGVAGLTYIGNHGLEWSNGFNALPDQHQVELIPEALPYVKPGKYLLDIAARELADLPGIIVQYKSVGGSIHYRLAPDPEQARIRILTTLEPLAMQAQMKIGEGKRVIEVLAPLHINKGQGLRRFVAQFGLQGVIFAGDDRTDLDAVLEVETLRRNGLAAHAIVVQHADTMPALLEHADSTVKGVEGMAQQLQAMVNQLRDKPEVANE